MPSTHRPRKISDAQARALRILKRDGPQAPGFFDSGWGPLLYGKRCHRVEITAPTAGALIRTGLARIRITGNKPKDKVLELTAEGEDAARELGCGGGSA